MPLLLQIVLLLTMVTLTVFLVLLLIQARRTAAAVERLAESSARDLQQMIVDIHEVRKQADDVANLARSLIESPSGLTQMVAGVVRAMPGIFSQKSAASNWIDSLLVGIQGVTYLLRRPKASPSKEAHHE